MIAHLFALVALTAAESSAEASAAPAAVTGCVRGNVVYRSGDPVCGADVALSPRGSVPPRRTNADGAFSFEGVAPGTWRIEARYQRTLDVHEARSEVAVEAGATAEVTLTLPLSPVTRVRVVGEGKKPIPSDLLVQYRTPQGTKGAMGRLLEPGEMFFVDSIPRTSELRIAAKSPGYMPSERRYSGKEDLPGEITIVLGTPATGDISGTLLHDGRPLAGTDIDFRPLDIALTGATLKTDDHGRFTVPPCPPCRACFRANLGARGGVFAEIELATVKGDGMRLEADPDNVIAGRVVDAKGRPLSGVQLAIREEWPEGTSTTAEREAWILRSSAFSRGGDSFHADAQGSFVIGGLPNAPMRICVPYPQTGQFIHGAWFGGPLAEIRSIKSGRRDVVLLVASAPALWVFLDDDKPCGSAGARLWNLKYKRPELDLGLPRTVMLRPGEECFLGFHPPAEYRLTLWGPEFPLFISEPFDLKPDMPPLRVSTRSGVPLRGRVVSDWALPEKLKVHIWAEVPGFSTEKASTGTTVTSDGTFTFPRIGPGTYDVGCYAERKMWKTQIVVNDSPPPEVVLRIGG